MRFLLFSCCLLFIRISSLGQTFTLPENPVRGTGVRTIKIVSQSGAGAKKEYSFSHYNRHGDITYLKRHDLLFHENDFIVYFHYDSAKTGTSKAAFYSNGFFQDQQIELTFEGITCRMLNLNEVDTSEQVFTKTRQVFEHIIDTLKAASGGRISGISYTLTKEGLIQNVAVVTRFMLMGKIAKEIITGYSPGRVEWEHYNDESLIKTFYDEKGVVEKIQRFGKNMMPLSEEIYGVPFDQYGRTFEYREDNKLRSYKTIARGQPTVTYDYFYDEVSGLIAEVHRHDLRSNAREVRIYEYTYWE